MAHDKPILNRIRKIQSRLGRIVAGSYDISDTCNLQCDGCLYFEHDEIPPAAPLSDAQWENMFAAEARRGVNFCYMSGAEPSFAIDRIRTAQRHIPRGVLFTNGVTRIPDDIHFRVHISVWGLGETGKSLRMADVLPKALENYRGDPRAVLVFTISAINIADIVPTAALAQCYGLPLTFSYFSPTTSYLHKLAASPPPSHTRYFHISDATRNPIMQADDYARAAKAIRQAMDLYPETVEYSPVYDEWVTQKSIYMIDPQTGIALNCGVIQSGQIHHTIDHGTHMKCCSPYLDCAHCRAYAMAYTTFFSRLRNTLASEQAQQAWLEAREIWVRIFMPIDTLKGLEDSPVARSETATTDKTRDMA